VTQSERTVGEVFRQIIPQRNGRILIASFASNVHRVQQAIDVALEDGRKVCLIGRSLRKNVNIARSLGYIDVPEDLLVKPDVLPELRPDETMILCTGSQGEPMSALTRMAYNDHQHVRIEEGDTVIISAKPVPGNELRVHDTINRLAKSGAEVLHQEIAPGPRLRPWARGGAADDPRRPAPAKRHARPRGVPHVGRPRPARARRGRGLGSHRARRNGSVVELANGRAEVVGIVESGATFVDGLGVGDVQDVALRTGATSPRTACSSSSSPSGRRTDARSRLPR
jgi:ribonuclease J